MFIRNVKNNENENSVIICKVVDVEIHLEIDSIDIRLHLKDRLLRLTKSSIVSNLFSIIHYRVITNGNNGNY